MACLLMSRGSKRKGPGIHAALPCRGQARRKRGKQKRRRQPPKKRAGDMILALYTLQYCRIVPPSPEVDRYSCRTARLGLVGSTQDRYSVSCPVVGFRGATRLSSMVFPSRCFFFPLLYCCFGSIWRLILFLGLVYKKMKTYSP